MLRAFNYHLSIKGLFLLKEIDAFTFFESDSNIHYYDSLLTMTFKHLFDARYCSQNPNNNINVIVFVSQKL